MGRSLLSVCVAAGALTAPALANNATPVLHPVDAACVTYEITGSMMNGATTRCHRDHGYEQYEIENLSVGLGGFTQEQNKHTITIGDTIYAIDPATNTGTKTKNPLYDNVVAALENTTPEEMGAAFVAAMGFSPTSTVKTIANNQCTVYNSAQLGAVCLMDNGLMLEQSFMGNTYTATEVTIGSGGDNANYAAYQNVTITEGPDLSNGLQGLMEQLGNQ